MRRTDDINYEIFKQKMDFTHAPYEEELYFYVAIKRGEVALIKEMLVDNPIGKANKGMGLLSTNPLHNIKYHSIICVALITRFCIEGGMDSETAYGLSDMYIQKIDVERDIENIRQVHTKMCIDYAQRMKRLQKDCIYSKNIVKCIDYIHEHINERIATKDLSVICGLHENYLSRLFKQETGICIGDYIRNLKIETAENMLKYSDLSLLEIANSLSFSSQSHFVKVFHDHTSMTPRNYRNRYYRKNWGDE